MEKAIIKPNVGDAWLSVNDKFEKATRYFPCRDSDGPVCDFEGDPEVSAFDSGFGSGRCHFISGRFARFGRSGPEAVGGSAAD